MTKINHINNKLIFGNQEYIFEYPIQILREDENQVYVLLDIPAKQEYTFDDFHNVYAFSYNGERKWQIGKRPIGDNDIYTLINVKEGILYAKDFSGRKYKVCEENGIPEKMQIVK
ncbi:hypothetical protein QJV15_07640 [Listeria cossartiae subsp. cayugensis]|uniref:hypothetical protein n=1 Tax=Listeria cossartiae TaxID=2838249 RepID=UPI0028804BB3|nr:hypothetical protein [Listeria cossartiae]MDT0000733.1 hypothetical protein [Listeria cossartiae subsp. cayugensis]MDT0009163.1 hypothetical protein [Listeria cossartiae subsp. cayugensis]MDT0030995.1 hypothetical protein [Listeria cossartiae subsp. cayugensis]MDT0039110.1 hypothetical protein [Listeria cossartiae subsp. cayugensis]MDT0044230.1 hypothetical protein [Listeria cossartiae subsp. cayugensis]